MAIQSYKKNGKVLFRVWIKARDSTGRQMVKQKSGITSEKEARNIEFEFRSELRGRKQSYRWPKWLTYCLEKIRIEFRRSTFVNYESTLRKWTLPRWEKLRIDEITSTDVHDLVFQVAGETQPFTKKDLLKKLKRTFNMAIEAGLITRNPCVGIRVYIPEVQQSVLSKSEIATLLEEAKINNHRFYYIWTVALLTGMRSGELYALKWIDVDLENKLIRVRGSWNSKGGFGPTKSAKHRVVPISSKLKMILMELQKQRGHEEFVLPHLREWTKGEQAKVLRDFCKAIGVTSVKFHDLRATFITQLLKNGESLARVMAIVGHAELKTTQGYLRLSGEDLKGATDKLGIEIPGDVEPNVIRVDFDKKND